MVSNGKFSSVEHRVVAKNGEPRVSVVCFFNTFFHPASTRMYMIRSKSCCRRRIVLCTYRETLVRDYVARYFAVGLDGREKTALNDFRL